MFSGDIRMDVKRKLIMQDIGPGDTVYFGKGKFRITAVLGIDTKEGYRYEIENLDTGETKTAYRSELSTIKPAE